MKLIALISCLPAATHAFQHAATAVHYKKRMETTRLDFYPENFDRAEKCATHVGSCGIDEIQQLAQELEEFQTSETDGQLQGRDHWRDTEQVAKMLRAQINLNHMMEDYVGDHHQPATFDMSDV